MRAPIALTQLLPMGVKGAFASICLMGMIAGNGMHMHSWGSIFIQDIVMPLRNRPLAPAQHLLILRLAVVGVAIWAFFFGILVPQTKYVALWWVVTEAVFVSGAGIAIIGGLYWSRGTTAAAWVAMILGAVLTLIGIGVHEYNVRVLHHESFHLLHVAFFVSLFAIVCYTVVSLLTSRTPHDMDKLLHRGAYAIEGDAATRPPGSKVSLFYHIFTLGIDHNFSRTDRIITIGITLWSMTWFTVFTIGSCVYLVHPWSKETWAGYWLIQAIYLPLLIGVATTIWFTIGSFRDMRVFFRRLRQEAVNAADDGRVTSSEPEAAEAGRKR
jgi:SSS family solute:Na+ symporter